MRATAQLGKLELIELWDGRWWPGRIVGGMPTFDKGAAPSGMMTRRQLRTAGLAPGGHEPWARLSLARVSAWLYRVDVAVPKRVPTPAQLAAVHSATDARKVCLGCGPVAHCVRKSDGLCGDCFAAGVVPIADLSTPPAAWQTLQEWAA
jgi:hypothetical protein